MKKILSLTIVALLLVSMVGIVASALTVYTDKSVYHPGDVVKVYGTATPNAVITLLMLNPAGKLIAVNQVTANETGGFSTIIYTFPEAPTADVPYGTYTITVYDSARNEKKTVTIEFSPIYAVLQGKVVDSEGNPVAGASVSLLKNGEVVGSTTTADDGSFTLQVNPGVYVLRVEKTGYAVYEEEIEMPAPSVYTKVVTLQFKALQVTIVSITHYRAGEEEKPFLGVVREGEAIKVVANVTYGDKVVADANVTVCIVPPEGSGLNKVTATLGYDSETGLYVGEIQVPSLGVDRKSTLTVKAVWENMTATKSVDMYILVDYTKQISELQSTVSDLKSSLEDLKSTVLDLQLSLGDLSVRLSTLEGTVNSLKETVAMLRETISELKFNTERLSISLNMLNASVTALAQRLGGLESRVSSLEKSLADLNSKVSSLESRVGTLESRVDALADSINTLAKSVDESMKKLADNVQQSINTLSNQVASLGKSLDSMTSTMNTNINNLKQTVDAVSSALYATLAVAIIALLISIVLLVFVLRRIKG